VDFAPGKRSKDSLSESDSPDGAGPCGFFVGRVL